MRIQICFVIIILNLLIEELISLGSEFKELLLNEIDVKLTNNPISGGIIEIPELFKPREIRFDKEVIVIGNLVKLFPDKLNSSRFFKEAIE